MTGSVAVGAATCGAGKLGSGVQTAVKVYDVLGGAVEMGRAGADMINNGPTVSNVAQMAAGGLGAGSAAGFKCFTEGTQIVVGEVYDENDVFVQYITVNIEDVKVGDWVYSYDTIAGEISQKEVTETIVLTSDHILYVTVCLSRFFDGAHGNRYENQKREGIAETRNKKHRKRT